MTSSPFSNHSIKHAAKSPETFKSFFPVFVNQLFSQDADTLESIFDQLLETVYEIIDSKSSIPLQKFYAVYLVLRISNLKDKKLLMEQLTKCDNLVIELFRIAQIDLLAHNVPIHKRGEHFFGKDENKDLARLGINFVRLCYESLIDWGTRYCVLDTKDRMYAYHFMAEVLKRKGKQPIRFYFINKEHNLCYNLANWNYADHDPPLIGESFDLKDAKIDLKAESEREIYSNRSEKLSQAENSVTHDLLFKRNFYLSPLNTEDEQTWRIRNFMLNNIHNQDDKEQKATLNESSITRTLESPSFLSKTKGDLAQIRASRVETLLESLRMKENLNQNDGNLNDYVKLETGKFKINPVSTDDSLEDNSKAPKMSKEPERGLEGIQNKIKKSHENQNKEYDICEINQNDKKSFLNVNHEVFTNDKKVTPSAKGSRKSEIKFNKMVTFGEESLVLNSSDKNILGLKRNGSRNEPTSLAYIEDVETQTNQIPNLSYTSFTPSQNTKQAKKYDPFSREPIPGQRIPGHYKIIIQDDDIKRPSLHKNQDQSKGFTLENEENVPTKTVNSLNNLDQRRNTLIDQNYEKVSSRLEKRQSYDHPNSQYIKRKNPPCTQSLTQIYSGVTRGYSFL